MLLEAGHVGKKYLLTGPETLRRADLVRLIGEAIGREVRFVELTHEEGLEALSASMGEWAQWYLDGMAQLVDHPQAAVQTVAEITGRPATTFARWAVKHAREFR